MSSSNSESLARANRPNNGSLSDLRIIDLADEKGLLCSKLLADMGADVIKVERPGGDDTRNIAPFYHGNPHPEQSLFFWHYNTNKRGVTLNLESDEGKEIFKRLVKTADAVVETNPPGYLDSIGLGYDVLSEVNPRVVVTSVTPFGQTGPWRDYKTSNTVACGLGGMMYVNGELSAPPVSPIGPQAYHSASYYAATATMCALMARDFTGRGQQVDVSIHECLEFAVEHVSSYIMYDNRVAKRQGTLHWSLGFRNGTCKDGYVLMTTSGSWDTLIGWLDSEGMAGDLTEEKYSDPRFRRENIVHVFDTLDKWARTHTVSEIVDEAQLRRLPWAPVKSTEELLEYPQLIDRGFFVKVEHPELNSSFTYPGAPYKFGKTPWEIRHRAPLIGEHNGEILGQELGLSPEQLAGLKEKGVI